MTTTWRGMTTTRRAAIAGMLLVILGLVSRPVAAQDGAPLRLAEVLASVRQQYPPLLAALVEREIASSRFESARGVFDADIVARLYGAPAGYYDYGTVDVGVEQFTGLRGSTIFGGYRLTRGDRLPDYYWNRTQGGGEPRLGLAVPLLRDGSIDRGRAALMNAGIDRELADPEIARQRLEFVRAATIAYFQWVAAGQRWGLAESLLRLANDRTAALAGQAALGLIPRIVLTDNDRLVVAREIAVVQAQRRFESASLTLSLFLRTEAGEPIRAARARVPADVADVPLVEVPTLEAGLAEALARRPELRLLDLALDKLEIERALANNQMWPNLDARVAISQDVGTKIYVDKSDFEVEASLELRVPLQRRAAAGRVGEIDGRIQQIRNEQRFLRDRIRAEVADAHSALVAALVQLRAARLNADLAVELQSADEERFRRGAVDLLTLQIREQAAFDARTLAVDALAEYFRSLADYDAVTAVEVAGQGDVALR